MLEKIKVATKSHHSSVEKVLVYKLKNLSSKEQYAKLLYDLYGFYDTIEKAVHNHINETVVPDIRDRTHVRNLKLDLINLGFKNIERVENPFSSKINSVSKALGVLYVMEGSTLGGQFIASMLKKQLPTLNDSHINYFLSYGENTMNMWNSFKNNLTKNPFELDEILALEGAEETFKELEIWLSKD